jgi:regulatory protein
VSERALELAYRHLSRRERSVAEMRQHLLRRGVDEPEVDAAIEELVEQGYLDDARFARLFVEDKRQLEQWGSERIRRGLSNRGIERELADVALREQAAPGPAPGDLAAPGSLDAPGDPARPADLGDAGGSPELGRALGLLRRRFAAAPRDRRERERALGMLLRKGYDPELALCAIRAYQQQ